MNPRRTILVVVFLLAFALVALAQQQIDKWPPPSDGATHQTYDASHLTYHLTRTDGTFGYVVIYDNSAAPGYPNTHDYSADAVNVDGQRNLGTFHWNGTQYVVSSLMDLDQDGHFSLGSSNGGGIASDPLTGDTCIPYNVLANGACNVPNAMHIAAGGTVTKYQGLATDGNGVSTIAKAINGSATGTVSNYLLWTTPPTGNYGATEYYELTWVGVVTNPAPGATATATWNFADESGANSCSSPWTAFGAVGNRLELTCRFFSVANTPIRISVVTNGSPTYASHARVIIY